jgi:hypothetical protein
MQKILYYAIVTLLIGLTQVSAASAYIVSFSSSYNNQFSVSNGGSYSINIILSGLSEDGTVAAYDLNVRYDTNLLKVNSVNFSTRLGADTSNQLSPKVLQDVKLDANGLINFAAVSLLNNLDLQALQSSGNGSIILATLNFTAIADGDTALSFQWDQGKCIIGNNNNVIFGRSPEPAMDPFLNSGMVALR